MNKAKQKPSLTFSYPKKTVTFILTFLLGLGMALGFAWLISLTSNSTDTTIKSLYLNLVLAGAFGGLLYSILLDGELELPSWSEKNPNNLKPGFLGEIFVGISGSFIAYSFLPEVLKKAEGDTNAGLLAFVTGVVGGYGGKYILDAALKKVINRIETADLAKEKAESEAKELDEKKRILDLVNLQIQEGLTLSDLSELKEKLETASPDVKKRAFTLATDARRLGRRAAQFKDRLKRTVPIFETLLTTNNDDPEHHAQLAFAQIDLEPPALDDAIVHLDQAIQLRGESIQGNEWEYEFHRAIARILLLQQKGLKANSAVVLSQGILQDLSVVDRTKGLGNAIDEYKRDGINLPIEEWLTQNQDWVNQQSDGKTLIQHTQLGPVMQTATLSVEASSVASPLVTSTSVPALPSQSVKSGSAKEAIEQLTRVSALPSTNTRTLTAVTPRLIQGSATATKVQPENLVIAPPNTIIKATTKTYLKKRPVESSQLSYNEIKEVLVGKEYKVLKYSEIVPERSQKNETVQHGSSQIPQSGIGLIKEFEGYEKKLADGRVQAYADPALGWKVPTIGYGTTVYPSGTKVKQGDIITKDKAEEYLIDHIDKKCRRALEKIPTWKQMNDNQRGALYSFAYNLGEGFYGTMESITNVCNSPTRWNDKLWIKQQFVKYSKSGGKTLSGLVRRREAEAKLFCTPLSTKIGKQENKVSQPLEAMNGHCLVELDYGQGTWYIWPNHWDLPWEDHHETHPVAVTVKAQESASTHTNPAVQRQMDRLTKYLSSGKTLNFELKTKYFSQRDNYRDQGRTCNSSSNAMYLDWLLRMIGKPGLDGDDGYLRKVFSIGDSPDHSVQTRAIKLYGFNTKWMTDRDTPFVEDLVEAGFPVVVNILHHGPITRPSGGHIIVLIDQQGEDWIAHDPWGTLKSNYKVHKGEYSRISKQEFKARWQGGYRTLA